MLEAKPAYAANYILGRPIKVAKVNLLMGRQPNRFLPHNLDPMHRSEAGELVLAYPANIQTFEIVASECKVWIAQSTTDFKKPRCRKKSGEAAVALSKGNLAIHTTIFGHQCPEDNS